MKNEESFDTNVKAELPQDGIVEMGCVTELTKGSWGPWYEPSIVPQRT